MPYKCFLVERTGNEKVEHHDCPDQSCACGGWDTHYDEWKRTDTGDTIWGWPGDFGVGAMYFCDEAPYEGKYRLWDNDDGKHLIVMTPGGSWDIDSRASNCTMPDDRQHRCWIRHGEVPNIHVDKIGFTCQAGAGSIMCGNYHGFLAHGELSDG